MFVIIFNYGRKKCLNFEIFLNLLEIKTKHIVIKSLQHSECTGETDEFATETVSCTNVTLNNIGCSGNY